MARTGRPCLLTPEVEKNICDGLRLGMTLEFAAQYAGIGWSTAKAWRQKGRADREAGRDTIFSAFLAATERAMARVVATHLATIHKAAQAGTWQASAWVLERRFGYRKTGEVMEAPETSAEPIVDADRLRQQAIAAGLISEGEE